MRIVIALGGNALLARGERPDADVQEHNVDRAVAALAPLAADHELLITHGNGPQVGVLALESAADETLSRPYPLASLGAETQGLIGFWLVQALTNELPGRSVVALVTRTIVDPRDPAFGDPTKFVGPVYDEREADGVGARRGWTMRRDGAAWRRVVPSPEPIEVVEAGIIEGLIGGGVVVVCCGGGGVPVCRADGGRLESVDAVIDKDLTSALLAQALGADALLLLTDVPGVQRGFGTPQAELLRTATVRGLRSMGFPAGSMGPKVEAACRFVEATGRPAIIGALTDTPELLTGGAGTTVLP